ncbi:uncharacterized protein LOC111637485 [Centruroides sculpturatus]|uniref:uncharacterized protein LOC111637485 n=1 Tax=Centruroides sculpturatus TaxID=218467 RepID=UPI000C6DB444|nr:uncharacterized protein LOC111637485 [Centruroides sculpturatus]
MKNNIENDNKKILLLFLLVLVQPFIFMYLLQHSNIRMASPVIEEGNMKFQKTNDENAIINENTIGHQVKKREITSETEKDCQGDCSLTPNSSEEDDDTIMINENWSVEKTDMLEFCFAADKVCGRNREKSKDEEKDNFGGEKLQENKNCILQEITNEEAFQYKEFGFYFRDEFRTSTLINIEEGPKDSYKIIFEEQNKRLMTEFRVNKRREVNILKQYELPEQMDKRGIIKYNGNIYSKHNNFLDGRIVKYNIKTQKLTFGDNVDFVLHQYYVLSLLPGDNCFWALNVIDYKSDSRAHMITIESGFMITYGLYKMDLDNLKVLSKRNFNLTCLARFMFVAYDKVYCVRDRSPKFYIRSASNDEEFLYFDLQKHPDFYHMERVFYNVNEQNLYVLFNHFETHYKFFVKKLHFNCSNED